MTFEQTLRDRIAKAPFKSKEKDLLKVVLGEMQQKAASGKVTDEQGHSLVKSMIKNNVEKVLVHLKTDDPRRAPIEEENKVLGSLLPVYLTAEQIMDKLTGGLEIAISAAKNEGQAVGLAMKYLKSMNAKVEGDTVKAVVQKMRV